VAAEKRLQVDLAAALNVAFVYPYPLSFPRTRE
jgi:hypothetical protein